MNKTSTLRRLTPLWVFLWFNLLFWLAVFTVGCRSARKPDEAPAPTEQAATPPDTTQSKRRLLGILPPRKAKPPITIAAGTTIRKVGRRATVIIQSGTGNTAAVSAKKSAPIVQADSGATVQVAAPKSVVAGQDADTRQTKQHWLSAVLPWLIGLLGLACVVMAVRRYLSPL